MSKNFKTNLVNVDTKGHANRPLSIPIYQTSTYEFDDTKQGGNRFALVEDGMIYTRLGNPTTQELEKKLAILENAEEAICFSSGMGAIAATLFELLQPGDELVIQRALYGCTSDLVMGMLTKWGVVVKFFDETIATKEDIIDLITDKTRVVYLESIANPTLSRLDPDTIRAIKEHKKGLDYTIVVDNTFASPFCFNPIDHGADVVIHSITKYIAGHTDVIAGCVVSNHEICTKIRWSAQKNIGAIMSPNDAYLTLRGLQTMAVRMNQSMISTEDIALFLRNPVNADLVEKVNYPTDKCEGYKGYGSCFSVEFKTLEIARDFCEALELFHIAVSLGGNVSLIEHPATMTHAIVPKEEREKAHIKDGLVRISVGLEDTADLLRDVEQALNKVRGN